MAVAVAPPEPTTTAQQDTTKQPDMRRITENDPALARLKTRTVRELTMSIRQLVRDLKRGEQPGQAQSHFIQRHLTILHDAYLSGFREGQRDYYDAVSRVPLKWVKASNLQPEQGMVARRMAFYAPSVAKMAHEAVQAFTISSVASAPSQQLTEAFSPLQQFTLAGGQGEGEREDNLAKWQSSIGARIVLQADLSWSGAQDGYIAAGWGDSANPFSHLWWDLEPTARHCDQCPLLAAASPFDPPWTVGGNVLDQTPGDGNTDCGAGCKCSLRYGGAADGALSTAISPRSIAPQGTPEDVVLPNVAKPRTPPRNAPAPPPYGGARGGSPAIPGGEFNDGQKRALDLYRLAELEWNAVRGELPELPNFFTLENEDFEWTRLEWNKLTRSQQKAIETALEAHAVWAAWAPSNWFDFDNELGFVEVVTGDDEDVVKLFNPNHDRYGRFAVGSGISHHDVSGGGSHGAAQHGGSANAIGHLRAHASAG